MTKEEMKRHILRAREDILNINNRLGLVMKEIETMTEDKPMEYNNPNPYQQAPNAEHEYSKMDFEALDDLAKPQNHGMPLWLILVAVFMTSATVGVAVWLLLKLGLL